ncbi:hypothetical protein [Arthrobacter sp. Marseille-P9274]|uniref:hypothetical protein n=1 Tax=Arthrobacter sp. Marseille-P9274 TaxID=2866572 RepID=UPI0021C838A4|nr:hypothetical protein [Arthrobacter sp. Marseille-P9274]
MQGPQQLLGRIRIERGNPEQPVQLAGEQVQPGRALARPRARAEQPGEDLFVHVAAPGQAGPFHFGGDQCPRGFGRHEELEPFPARRTCDGGQLVLQFQQHRFNGR